MTRGSRAHGSFGRLDEDEINREPPTAPMAEANRFPKRPFHEPALSSEDTLKLYALAVCSKSKSPCGGVSLSLDLGVWVGWAGGRRT